MAAAKKAETAYENPLIPNARLRQIYLAMVQARLLEKALPAGRRGRAVAGVGEGRSAGTRSAKGYAAGIAGMEACLVSTSVDLGPGDLVSDALAGGVVEYLRGAGLKRVLGSGGAASRNSGPAADCGTAGVLAGEMGVEERLWVALGAAAGLKTAAMRVRSEAAEKNKAGEAEKPAAQPGVVVAYVRPGEATAGVWRGALEFAAKQELPIVFVVMPGPRGGGKSAGGIGALALRCGVPGIAVDGDDAVAIYRVAQESIGRARAGGGAALMECVPFVLPGGKGSQADAIAGMERYLLQRNVVTKRWMEREAGAFARRLAVK